MHDDELVLGAVPRPQVRPRLRTVLVLAGTTALVIAVAALIADYPRRGVDTAYLSGTGMSCTVGYGADMVVVAVEVVNNSPNATAALTEVGLVPSGAPVVRIGGPVDVVAGTGCEHVLRLSGDSVPSKGRLWLGLTVRIDTCAALEVPVRVTYDDGTKAAGVTIGVPVAANTAPTCGVAVGAARGG